MNLKLVFSFLVFSFFSFSQNEAKTKRVTIEQAMQDPKLNDYKRIEEKEFDFQGNEVSLKVFDKQTGKEQNRVETSYDSLNREVLINCYDRRPIRNGLWQTIDFTYTDNTVIKCISSFGSGDTVRYCEISLKKYDENGTVYSTQVEKTNPDLLKLKDENDPKKNRHYNRPQNYSSDYHRYTYDSLKRIVNDTNLFVVHYRGTYRISNYTYQNDKRILHRVEYPQKWDSLDGPIDSLFLEQVETYHSNGKVATISIVKHSSLSKHKVDEKVYFKYDSAGNKLEYAIKTVGPDGKKVSWSEQFAYTFDDKGRIQTKVLSRKGRKQKSEKEYFRYVYEEW